MMAKWKEILRNNSDLESGRRRYLYTCLMIIIPINIHRKESSHKLRMVPLYFTLWNTTCFPHLCKVKDEYVYMWPTTYIETVISSKTLLIHLKFCLLFHIIWSRWFHQKYINAYMYKLLYTHGNDCIQVTPKAKE